MSKKQARLPYGCLKLAKSEIQITYPKSSFMRKLKLIKGAL